MNTNLLNKGFVQGIIAVCLVLLGVLYVNFSYNKIEEEQAKEVIHIARSVEALLPKIDLNIIKAEPDDINKPEYKILKKSLKAIIRVNPKARFAYVYVEKNGKIYFLADSEPENSPEYSPPGQEYTEAKEEDKKPFRDGQEHLTVSLADRWGTWTSALIPIKDSNTGKTIAVFGMDFNAKSWNQKLMFEIAESGILVVLLIIVLFVIINIRTKNQSLSHEIKERKQAVDALKESEVKYRELVENSPDAIAIFADKKIVYINKECLHLMRASNQDELLNKPVETLIHPAYQGQILKRIKNSGNDGASMPAIEGKFIRLDGSEVDVEVITMPIRINKKKALQFIIRDITERKHNVEALIKNDERLKRQREAIVKLAIDVDIIGINVRVALQKLTKEVAHALNVSQVSVWSISDDGKEMICVSRYQAEDALPGEGTVLKAIEFPEYFEAISRDSLVSASDAQNDPRTKEFNELYLKPAGITSMLDAAVWINGKPAYLICFEHIGEKRTWFADEEAFANTAAAIIMQIFSNSDRLQAEEALRESEERHRILFVNSPDPYLILIDGVFVDCNAATELMFGAERMTIVGKTPEFLSPEFQPDGTLSAVAAKQQIVTANYTGNHTFEWVHKRKDGSDFYAEVSIASMILNKKPALFTALRDITERKKVEFELLMAKEKAEESDRLKTAFLANMSHEIRTPMNGILGFTELLKNTTITGEQRKEYIEIIQKSGDRLLNIINDVLDISKIEAGQMDVALSETSINEQINYLYAFFKPETESKGLKLSYNKGLPDQESIVYTDQEKVYAVLINLLKNAIKFCDSGSIEFGYSLSRFEGNGMLRQPAEIKFYVKDTGIGIPLNRQNAIFDRFVQADIADSRAFQGAGLGLSISKAFVDMLGGKLWVESEEGVGSVFYFTIPYSTNEDKNKSSEILKDNKEIEVEMNNKLKILVVEDDETSRMLIELVLQKYNFNMLFVASGSKAIEVCQNNPDIDLILMDIKMPLMDGYEATRHIRKFNTSVIIIAQTAFGEINDRIKALDAGCNDYLSKPISIDELESCIQKNMKR